VRAFIIHLGIFVLVVGVLVAINLYRSADHVWFIWVLAGWGIGVAAHDLALLLQRTGRRSTIIPSCCKAAGSCSRMPESTTSWRRRVWPTVSAFTACSGRT